MSKKNKSGGEERFEEYYSALYGGRWPSLRASLLLAEKEKVSPEGLKNPYYMDVSSLVTASLLPVKKGMKVLDMCAAPGGKSLVLALALEGWGSLTSNDRSPERRRRMRDVFSLCLPDGAVDIRITGFNAESWGLYEKNEYDSILLDAPCSSERHVMKDPRYLSQWSPSRPKRLSQSQYAMLSSALMAVKEGGYILYSTCSINRCENEAVIEKLFSRHGEEVEEIECTLSGSEPLEYGRIILPDTSTGLGPMYSCLLRKKVLNEE